MDGLRQAGHEWVMPRGLLARAALRRVATPEAGKGGRSDAGGARDDLLEAQEIAERGGDAAL